MAPSSVLCVTWNGGGNVSPMLALAQRLDRAGSEVTVLGEPSQQARFDAGGLAFVGRDEARLWDPTAMAEDVVETCRSRPVAVAIVDYMLPGALCGAEAAGVDRVVLVHTLYRALLVDGAPEPMSMAGSVEAINEARRAVGLAPVGALGDLLASASTVLVTCPGELDAPDRPTADNVHHVGPIFEDPSAAAAWGPPPGDDPLVVVSLGTTPMDEAPVVQRVLDALATMPVRALVTVGDHLDGSAFVAGANTTVTGFLPHAAVLPHAALVVTHGGLGTVLAALANGVPLLCLPLGREQPDNARAVERMGAGRSCPPSAVPAEIRRVVGELLADPGPARGAAAMQSAIAASPDVLARLAS